MGRKSKYNEEYHLAWISGLARRGCTIEEIADDLGVAVSTVNKWIKENEKLSDAIKKARTIPDIKVEDSLYKRALGFKTTKTRTIVQSDRKGGNTPSKVEIIEEHVAPDTLACIFWLKNRIPKYWRDTQDVNAKVESGIELKPLTHEEIEMLQKMANAETKK